MVTSGALAAKALSLPTTSAQPSKATKPSPPDSPRYTLLTTPQCAEVLTAPARSAAAQKTYSLS